MKLENLEFVWCMYILKIGMDGWMMDVIMGFLEWVKEIFFVFLLGLIVVGNWMLGNIYLEVFFDEIL